MATRRDEGRDTRSAYMGTGGGVAVLVYRTAGGVYHSFSVPRIVSFHPHYRSLFLVAAVPVVSVALSRSQDIRRLTPFAFTLRRFAITSLDRATQPTHQTYARGIASPHA